MTIPLVPFDGRISYCLVRSLQMVLAYQGHSYELPWLECVSGEPFGFVYIHDGDFLLAVNGHEYHRAGEHLLKTLNYTYDYSGFPDATTALAALEEALKSGPVAVGMLDAGYLSYAPNYQSAAGADHALVVLALQSDRVIVHDPSGFPAVPLPLNDFLEAWQRDIYTGKPYGLWRIGAQGEPPAEETIWERTLARARENFARPSQRLASGPPLICGPDGMLALAKDIPTLPEHLLGALPYWSWRVSGQRCLDSALFLQERMPEAAAIRWEECQLYGALQQATVANQRNALPALLEQLAEQETRFIAALG
jgi:hypothetical protein